MDANLNFLTASAPGALSLGDNTPSVESKSPASRSMLGQEFANLMRSLLPDSERQGLAAANPVAGANSLQTLNLGNQFSLVTSATPQPDEDSLAAFAKSQGLADSAVQALFGDLKPLTSKLIQTDKLQGIPDVASATTPAEPSSATNLLSLTPGWFVSNPIAQSQAAATFPVPPVAHAETALPALASIKASGWPLTLNSASPADSGAADDGSTAKLVNLLAAHGASASITQLPKNDTVPLVGPQDPAQGTEAPEPGPLDVMRLRLIPAWETMTRELAKATGSEQAMTWANLANGLLAKAQTNSVAESVIDLGDALIGSAIDTPDGISTVSATFNNDNLAQLGHAAEQAPTLNLTDKSTSTTALSPLTDRAAQISQMADKLGQALSERMQNQIEQGQWKLELRLKPAHLGKISVELDMNSGILDAVFKSDNALTRELIAQGQQKLRDNLAQAGMTVANVWVNSNGQQSTGGNPTPRQSPAQVQIPQSEPTVATDLKVLVKSAKSTDGWDELV